MNRQFLRLHQIIGTKEQPGPLPVSRSTFYQMIKDGRAPKPVKLGPRAVAWRAEDIDQMLNTLGQEVAA